MRSRYTPRSTRRRPMRSMRREARATGWPVELDKIEDLQDQFARAAQRLQDEFWNLENLADDIDGKNMKYYGMMGKLIIQFEDGRESTYDTVDAILNWIDKYGIKLMQKSAFMRG